MILLKKISFVLAHARDILILPAMVTGLVPYWIYNTRQRDIPNSLWVKIPGVLALISGLALLAYTITLFGKIAKGTLAPWSGKEKLVIAGPYRYCRNPMISGVLFILSGEALLFHSTNILSWAGIFFVFNTIYFIVVEEPFLLGKFGTTYREYKKRVPRWIPRWKPYIPQPEQP